MNSCLMTPSAGSGEVESATRAIGIFLVALIVPGLAEPVVEPSPHGRPTIPVGDPAVQDLVKQDVPLPLGPIGVQAGQS